jgi:DNA-binding response OmpR family regulator
MNSPRILLIGNDTMTELAVKETIEREDLVLIAARDSQTGLQRASTTFPQVVLVDVNASATANIDLCLQLRLILEETPIIVLSPIHDEIEKVMLLELWADDYIVKPFSPRELLARIRALLRRAHPRSRIHQFSDVGVNLTHRVVNKGGEEVKLTPSEYNLLAFFVQHPNRVVTRDMILNSVWGYYTYPNTRTVDVHVMKLRQKLEPDQKESKHFRTVHGVGYRFVPHG